MSTMAYKRCQFCLKHFSISASFSLIICLSRECISLIFHGYFKAEYEGCNLCFNCLFHLLVSGRSRPSVRGEGGGGLVSKIFFSAFQASVLGLKILGVGALLGPSPRSATVYKPVFRTLNCCEQRGIQLAGGSKFCYIMLNKSWAKNCYGHSV